MADSVRSPEPAVYASIALGEWTGRMIISGIYGGTIASPPAQWIEWLNQLVSDRNRLPGRKVLKTSASVEVFEAELPLQRRIESPQRVVCKQIRSRGTKESVVCLFRRSAARRNFERAANLKKNGIQTALPLAYVERRWRQESWLVTEFVDGVIDLDAFVLRIVSRSGLTNRIRKNLIIRSVAEFFRGLERAGLYHRDMKASNILLAHAMDSMVHPQACIVDLDGLEKRRPWKSTWKPIVRLAASLVQYPAVTRTDYARFLAEFLAAGGQDASAWRSHFHRLRKQAARYSQAAQQRKSKKLDGFAG